MSDNELGEAVGDVTGWLGWRTRKLSPNHVHILGYPGNLDDGDEMHQVTAGASSCCFEDNGIFGCNMREGASGSPWIQNFGIRASGDRKGKNKAKNRVVGVSSWAPADQKILVMGSSIPKANFRDLVNAACDDAPGNCG